MFVLFQPLLYTSALLLLCILAKLFPHFNLSLPSQYLCPVPYPSTSPLVPSLPPSAPSLSSLPHLLVDVGLLNEGVEHVENTVDVPHLVILPQDLDLLR